MGVGARGHRRIVDCRHRHHDAACSRGTLAVGDGHRKVVRRTAAQLQCVDRCGVDHVAVSAVGVDAQCTIGAGGAAAPGQRVTRVHIGGGQRTGQIAEGVKRRRVGDAVGVGARGHRRIICTDHIHRIGSGGRVNGAWGCVGQAANTCAVCNRHRKHILPGSAIGQGLNGCGVFDVFKSATAACDLE